MFLDSVWDQILWDINTVKSHQNLKQNDVNMDLFFNTPISTQLVKTHFYCQEFNI